MNQLAWIEVPLAALLRITDQSGRAAHQQEGTVTRGLQPSGQHQLHQVAHVDARCGRVETDIGTHLAGVEGRAQRVRVGGVRDETAPGQFFQYRIHNEQA